MCWLVTDYHFDTGYSGRCKINNNLRAVCAFHLKNKLLNYVTAVRCGVVSQLQCVKPMPSPCFCNLFNCLVLLRVGDLLSEPEVVGVPLPISRVTVDSDF